jgi:hypothetical protein
MGGLTALWMMSPCFVGSKASRRGMVARSSLLYILRERRKPTGPLRISLVRHRSLKRLAAV